MQRLHGSGTDLIATCQVGRIVDTQRVVGNAFDELVQRVLVRTAFHLDSREKLEKRFRSEIT